MMTISVLGSLAVFGAENVFRSCHLFDPLLHLVADVISKLETHEDILYFWRCECYSDECPW